MFLEEKQGIASYVFNKYVVLLPRLQQRYAFSGDVCHHQQPNTPLAPEEVLIR